MTQPDNARRARADARSGEGARLAREMDDYHRRRWGTPLLVFAVVISLLLGAIGTLLALPDDAITTDQLAIQRALVQTSVTNEDLQATIDALRADIAAKDAQIAQLEAAATDDVSAEAAAAGERSTALDDREAALAQREAALEAREAAVEAAESGGAAGIALPDLDDLQLPEISEEQARGIFDRLIDRLRDIAGIDVPR